MENIDEIQEIMDREEALHKDLAQFLDVKSNSFPTLRHPLVYSIPYSPRLNALLNKQYEQKTKRSTILLEKGNYEGYVFMHERPWRFQAFQKVFAKLNDQQYWELLNSLWTDSENIWQNKTGWKMFFRARYGSRHLFMSKEDKKVFDKLPDEITIYRGYTKGRNKSGYSYTLDKAKAKWFSTRFNRIGGEVLTRVVKKKDVLAYTNARGEKEIVIIK